jgi:hypothetical protein
MEESIFSIQEVQWCITKKRVKFYINVRWKKVFFDSRGTESNFTHLFICVFPKNRALTCDGRKYFSIQEVQWCITKKKESNFTHTFIFISKKPRIFTCMEESEYRDSVTRERVSE